MRSVILLPMLYFNRIEISGVGEWMKRVTNGLIDLVIFTIAFLAQEVLSRTDVINVQDSLWIEYISFIAIYLMIYIMVKVVVFYMRRKKRKQVKNQAM